MSWLSRRRAEPPPNGGKERGRRGSHGPPFCSGLTVLVVTALFSVQPCEAQTYQVQDSAGIAVVVTGADAVEPVWSIDDSPSLTIGQIDGEEPYLFTWIWDALSTPDGRLLVVEGSSYEVRVFSPEGLHETTFGGRGGGPEEVDAEASGAGLRWDFDAGQRTLDRCDDVGCPWEYVGWPARGWATGHRPLPGAR